jgi:hypothetical protein
MLEKAAHTFSLHGADLQLADQVLLMGTQAGSSLKFLVHKNISEVYLHAVCVCMVLFLPAIGLALFEAHNKA